MLDTPQQAVLLLDDQLRVLQANALAQRALHLPANTPLPQLPPLRTGAGARLSDWLRQAAQAQREGRRSPPEPTLRQVDGSRLVFRLQALEPLSDPAWPHPACWLLRGLPGRAAAQSSSTAKSGAVGLPATPALHLLPELLTPALLYDLQGRIHHCNAAAQQALGECPEHMQQLPGELAQSLGWPELAAVPDKPLMHSVLWRDAQGAPRWARTQASAWAAAPGCVLASWVDDSANAALELARQQLEALSDLSGAALASYQDGVGWLNTQPQFYTPRRVQSSAAQGVNRDMVCPESLPAYEQLRQALKRGEHAELAYAVQHPELGRRWLRTRVTPSVLPLGQRVTTVVTLDTSAQQQALSRSELLRQELSTLMDGAGLGLACLRNGQLLRTNGAWGRMLGHEAEPAQGTPLARVFANCPPEVQQQIQQALPELDDQGVVLEFCMQEPQRWLSLALRRVSEAPDDSDAPAELIAVLTDISRLKAQQAELAQLAQDRELMFSLTDVGIAFIRGERLERANEALAAALGYRIHELSGLEHHELFESRGHYQHESALIQQALRQQGQWRGERRVRRRDGSALWMQVSMRLLRPGDALAGVIATYVNVDDRHRVQQSLLIQTERERAVLDSVLVGIVTVGRGGIEWMNRSARRMFGGVLAEFAGKPMEVVATPDPDHPFRLTHYLDELAEGQAETFECRLKARDGREFWVVGNAVVTDGGNGRQLTYALLDIERRRQAEALSERAQASLRRIIEAAPMAISLHDARTLEVLQLNQAATELVGHSGTSPHSLKGASLDALFDVQQRQAIRADMQAALQSNAVAQHEYRLHRDDQPQVWDVRMLHLSSVSDADPDSEQLLLVASDVTQQRAQEAERLQDAIAQRELLVREVHHRIKNNLQGVAGLLQQIAARRPDVKTILTEAVGQVQAIAQVYGLQVGASGSLRMAKVVEAITASVQRMFGRPIHTHIDGPLAAQAMRWTLPEAESIPIALTLNELLTNAIKHSVDAPVRCTLVCETDRVRVDIVNQGQLPEGFDLAKIPSGVSGLGLVRALLPRRSATLSLEPAGSNEVRCSVLILPPSVSLADE
ncbi:PAS domain S-box protein [Roseateles sp. BYS180W]|uniref:PAS domain S-box protein n=1 Tax=Roseateles rivi TaxID=3299028 RepID=A0ABW7FUZ2_9BURK